ncbi:MAG TPA: hypothetical protein VEA37_13565, partial [Flavobacterium sp.]|nr:hypothetical protein [Flavobacterium sp.]
APHRRNRVFVVTNSTSNRLPAGSKYFRFLSKDVESDTRTWNGELLAEPGIQRVVNGVPTEMDKDRLKALGNAVVPQQIYPIFKAIAEIERSVINV